MKFTFKHLTGSRAGQEQLFEGSVVGVGRNPTNQIAFDPTIDDRVSGNHAQLVVMADGAVTVNDLGSRNGTLVNGKKITGPTPVPNGAVVEFGTEGGPKVLVTYTASAGAPAVTPAPAAAPPAAKSGGGGKACAIGCVVLLMFGLCIGLGYGGYLVYSRGDGEETSTSTDVTVEPTDSATTDTPNDAPGGAIEAPPPTPTATEPAPRKKVAWARLGVGSMFEMKSVTEMKMGEQTFNSESTLKQTLVGLDDTHATVKTEVFVPNVASPEPTEQKMPIYPDETATGEKPETLEEKTTDVTVPAGTFSCTYRKTKSVINGQEMTMETWHDEAQPLPYKSIVVSPTSRTVTELTKIEKK